MFIKYNPNPKGARVGDCAIRAVCKATGDDWESAYINVCLEGLLRADMPSSNAVWGMYLQKHGFKKSITEPGTTLNEFCWTHPEGMYVAALTGHVVTVYNGNFYDTWDSGDELVLYYWYKEEK